MKFAITLVVVVCIITAKDAIFPMMGIPLLSIWHEAAYGVFFLLIVMANLIIGLYGEEE